MKLLSLAVAFATYSLTVNARSATSDIAAGHLTPIFQFGQSVEIENLAVRPNGNILFTTPSPSAEVWQINPSQNNGSAERVAIFDKTSALGITQVDPTVYAVSVGNLSSTMSGVVGSFAIHLLDFARGSVQVTKTIEVPDAKFLNKLAMLDRSSRILLATDSQRGLVYAIDLNSGVTKILLQDSATMNATASFFNGVNGIQRVKDFVYYTNSAKGLLCRVHVSADGVSSGRFETVANITSSLPHPDDFAILPDGRAFIVGSNEVLYVDARGRYKVIEGGVNNKELAGVTSAQLGVGQNTTTLFLTTSGHISKPASFSFTEPGRILSLEIDGL